MDSLYFICIHFHSRRLFVHAVVHLSCAQEMNCGSIGSQPPDVGSNFTADASFTFYLNIENPATCRGNVTRWRYCYYSDGVEREHRVRFAVYRRREDMSSYDRVSSVFTATGPEEIDRFDCGNLEVGQNEYAQVEVGDVIGVCITGPPGDARPLFVIGRGAPGHSLMGGASCSYNSLPDNANPRNRMNGFILHVYATEIIQTLTSKSCLME